MQFCKSNFKFISVSGFSLYSSHTGMGYVFYAGNLFSSSALVFSKYSIFIFIFSFYSAFFMLYVPNLAHNIKTRTIDNDLRKMLILLSSYISNFGNF